MLIKLPWNESGPFAVRRSRLLPAVVDGLLSVLYLKDPAVWRKCGYRRVILQSKNQRFRPPALICLRETSAFAKDTLTASLTPEPIPDMLPMSCANQIKDERR